MTEGKSRRLKAERENHFMVAPSNEIDKVDGVVETKKTASMDVPCLHYVEKWSALVDFMLNNFRTSRTRPNGDMYTAYRSL
ncbi:hypothetical protein KIN20_012107 [Parelaphostrongylus tenuis]|uniref:Uncharacterized protein n=1 Tax=Parelaphostrongylus tenuis TaxID=148309 RepID=A0AAD5MDY2_PARTN|nr:hypothetical protein KIN20_012107 [Parelaphostrongylus tenuis]